MHSCFLLVPTTHSAGSCYGERKRIDRAFRGGVTGAANWGKEQAKTDRFRQLCCCAVL